MRIINKALIVLTVGVLLGSLDLTTISAQESQGGISNYHDGKPEVWPGVEVKPERPEVWPGVEVKPERPEVWPGVEVKPERPEVRPEVEVKPERPEVWPGVEAKPERPEVRPEVEVKPERPEVRPEVEAKPEQPKVDEDKKILGNPKDSAKDSLVNNEKSKYSTPNTGLENSILLYGSLLVVSTLSAIVLKKKIAN